MIRPSSPTSCKLDDHDIMGAVKVWCDHPDTALAQLASDLVYRRNLRIRLQEEPWDAATRRGPAQPRGQAPEDRPAPMAERFVITGSIVNNAYDPSKDRIELLYKDGSLRDIAEASDNLGIAALSKPGYQVVLGLAEVVGGVRGKHIA